MEKYVTGTGQKLNVHEKKDCRGEHCVIHNPSDHHMKDYPTNWRPDRYLMERICPHGVGHPDPDDIKFKMDNYMGGRFPEHIIASTIHGCDGCCIKEKSIEANH